MARGGSRVNSGPAPDPQALRRERPEDRAGWTILKAEGRKGKAPAWPLLGDIERTARLDIIGRQVEELEDELNHCTVARTRKSLETKLAKVYQEQAVLARILESQREIETEVWVSAWKSPQAIAWEKLGWTREVAQYVRHKVLGELGSLEDAKEARQWSDRLGLNPAAMLRLRWKIAPTSVTQPASTGRTPAKKKATGSRQRLKVLDGGKA